MELHESIATIEEGLKAALTVEDWMAAERHVDRLKQMLFDAAAAQDRDTVARLQEILPDAGELLELRHRLAMTDDVLGAAWRLRADAGTFKVAGRMLPPLPRVDDIPNYVALEDRIFSLLGEANAPMPNDAIAARLNADASHVSRSLGRLEAQGVVRRWKAGKYRMNSKIVSPEPARPVLGLEEGRKEITRRQYRPKFYNNPHDEDIFSKTQSNPTLSRDDDIIVSPPHDLVVYQEVSNNFRVRVLSMIDSNRSDALSALIDLIQQAGYRAKLDEEHGLIESTMSGLKTAIFPSGISIQLYCGMTLTDQSGFGVAEANAANSKFRFAKFYIDKVGDLALEADFLFEPESENALNDLEKILALWEGSLSLMKEELRDVKTRIADPDDVTVNQPDLED